MESYSNVYIGYVDILGYKNIERRLDTFGKSTSAEIISGIISYLDSQIKTFDDTQFTWKRYGDGYVFFSHNEKIDNLSKIIKNCCRLISMALVNKTIPLRLAIIQGDIKIKSTSEGITVSGSRWDRLRRLEQALNWMGGILYLPTFNGSHHSTIQKLIQTTYLVKQQENSVNKQHFRAPFKEGEELNKERTWFLNWHKLLHLPKIQLDQQIKNWWGEFPGKIDEKIEDVLEKQKNSIEFADYCRLLYEAANLLFFSEVDETIQIGEINNFK